MPPPRLGPAARACAALAAAGRDGRAARRKRAPRRRRRVRAGLAAARGRLLRAPDLGLQAAQLRGQQARLRAAHRDRAAPRALRRHHLRRPDLRHSLTHTLDIHVRRSWQGCRASCLPASTACTSLERTCRNRGDACQAPALACSARMAAAPRAAPASGRRKLSTRAVAAAAARRRAAASQRAVMRSSAMPACRDAARARRRRRRRQARQMVAAASARRRSFCARTRAGPAAPGPGHALHCIDGCCADCGRPALKSAARLRSAACAACISSRFRASLPLRPHPRHTADAHTAFNETQHTALHLRVSVTGCLCRPVLCVYETQSLDLPYSPWSASGLPYP